MNELVPISDAVSSVVDLLTAGYRFAYRSATGPDGVSPSMVAPTTWLIGSVATFVAFVLLAFAWDAMFMALRWRARLLLSRATLGANLRRARTLVDQYVRFDRTAGILQRLSGVIRQSEERHPPDAFTKRARGSRAAALVLLLPAAVRWLVTAARHVLTTVLGLLSLAATWWAMGRPGLTTVLESIHDWQRQGTLHLSPTGISVVGVVLAALTFVLSRMRGPVAVGHQAWRRNESTHASNDLADREIAIDKAVERLEQAEWAVHSSWESTLLSLRQVSVRQIAEKESELRQLLQLPQTPKSPRLAHWGYGCPDTLSPRDIAVNDAAAAIKTFRKHLDKVTDRTETRVRRSVPWRVVRLASRMSLSSAIWKIDAYLDVPRDLDVRLTPAVHYARLAAASVTKGALFGPFHGDLDPATIPEADRLKAVVRAREEWDQEVSDAMQDHERHAHDRLVRGLIGMAELQAASDAIFAYVHPAGPITKLREWLRPA